MSFQDFMITGKSLWSYILIEWEGGVGGSHVSRDAAAFGTRSPRFGKPYNLRGSGSGSELGLGLGLGGSLTYPGPMRTFGPSFLNRGGDLKLAAIRLSRKALGNGLEICEGSQRVGMTNARISPLFVDCWADLIIFTAKNRVCL